MADFDVRAVGLHPLAVGAELGTVHIRTGTPDSSGDTSVERDGQVVEVEMRTLDEFGFEDVDFVKVDNEAYELFALMGGEQTIRRCRQVVIVVQNPGKARKYGLAETDAVTMLEPWRATLRAVMSGHLILAWRGAEGRGGKGIIR